MANLLSRVFEILDLNFEALRVLRTKHELDVTREAKVGLLHMHGPLIVILSQLLILASLHVEFDELEIGLVVHDERLQTMIRYLLVRIIQAIEDLLLVPLLILQLCLPPISLKELKELLLFRLFYAI